MTGKDTANTIINPLCLCVANTIAVSASSRSIICQSTYAPVSSKAAMVRFTEFCGSPSEND